MGGHMSFDFDYQNNNFLINTTPIYDIDNNVSSALLVFIDNTSKKRIEKNILNMLRKEQELNKLKSSFISMASHEFRTPLTAISSSAMLIGKQNGSGEEDKRLKYVTQIKKNVENLVVILNDFLSLGKLEEGKVLPKPCSFDLIDFSKSIIQEVTPNFKDGQDINFIHDKSEVLVWLDQKLTYHLLINLLSNAIKYSPKDKNILLSISNRNERVILKVKDEGIGIPLEDRENIFQRFYRAHNTNNIEGTGLGLNIVKQYVELMNGHVSVNSKINGGTTFIVELPLSLKK
jgi:signal transduction histidine kinase